MIKTNMTMSYEELTPEMASNLLESNDCNRKISPLLVDSYARDILEGNWDESVGVAISIDENGILRDGQHRCGAVVKAGKPIKVWICRNVSEDGIYDNNRKRSSSDQISIMRPDLESIYRSTRTISVIRLLVQHERFSGSKVAVSPKQIMDYIDNHKETLDVFFKSMPSGTIPKISLAVVFGALYLAFLGGEDIEKITDYYDILTSGMSSSPTEYPIIAYRNYLLNVQSIKALTNGEIARCQYSFKKYTTGACTKKTIEPKALIWDFPKAEKTEEGND